MDTVKERTFKTQKKIKSQNIIRRRAKTKSFIRTFIAGIFFIAQCYNKQLILHCSRMKALRHVYSEIYHEVSMNDKVQNISN